MTSSCECDLPKNGFQPLTFFVIWINLDLDGSVDLDFGSVVDLDLNGFGSVLDLDLTRIRQT